MATRFFPNYKANFITSKYGQRVHPITKVKKMHNGIDMTATNDGKTGQVDYITAHTGGTVEKVGYDVSAGNFVNIRVDSETIMAYYHMKNKSHLKKGEKVKQGDVIGYMGKTGSATGAHLHWGIKKNGAWIDPTPYLDTDYIANKPKMTTVQLPVLKKGSKGESVKALQVLLNYHLGYKLDIDGSFGKKTLEAVQVFQKKVGLTADGSVGPATWAKLIASDIV